MSDHDSGVDSAGEDSIPALQLNEHHNLDAGFQNDQRNEVEENMNEGDHDYAQEYHQQVVPFNNNNIDVSRNTSTVGDSPILIDHRQEQMMMSMPSTSRQQPSMDVFSLLSSALYAPSSSQKTSCPFVMNPNPSSRLQMRTVSISESTDGDSSSSEPSNIDTSSITAVNLNGFNFTVKPEDLKTLWSFYQQNNYTQHNFEPIMKDSKSLKSSRLRRKRLFNPMLECLSSVDELAFKKAVDRGDLGFVQRLVMSNRIDVNVADSDKRTALHLAAVRGHNEIALTLLANGANPNLRDIVGNTPLHLAVCASKLDMVIILLEHGANCTSSDNSGRTPIHMARSKLIYMSKSLSQRKENRMAASMSSSANQFCQNFNPENVRMEAMKISIMLGIYFEKCNREKPRSDIDAFKNRFQSSQTENEIENDVNDLLKCMEEWVL